MELETRDQECTFSQYDARVNTRSKRMLARVFVPADVLRLSNSCDFDEMAKRQRQDHARRRPRVVYEDARDSP